MKIETETIRIPISTKKKLDELFEKKDDTYNKIILRLLKKASC